MSLTSSSDVSMAPAHAAQNSTCSFSVVTSARSSHPLLLSLSITARSLSGLGIHGICVLHRWTGVIHARRYIAGGWLNEFPVHLIPLVTTELVSWRAKKQRYCGIRALFRLALSSSVKQGYNLVHPANGSNSVCPTSCFSDHRPAFIALPHMSSETSGTRVRCAGRGTLGSRAVYAFRFSVIGCLLTDRVAVRWRRLLRVESTVLTLRYAGSFI
jgi:hypothetical protein